MQYDGADCDEYIKALPDDRKAVMTELRDVIKKNIPKGFNEEMNYGMIGYVVPHSLYPKGYHCDPTKPLPFINIASQKHFIGFYHLGIYAHEPLMSWFVDEYKKVVTTKLDMGKSCIRFKKFNQIPFKLLGELCSKITPQEWIKLYEQQLQQRKK